MKAIRIPSSLLRASDTIAAAALLAVAVFSRSHGAVRVNEVRRRELEGGNADLYLPPGPPSPGIVLALGALREGRRYPLLESTARAIAAVGFAVLVPELGRLRSLILGMDAVEDLVHAAEALPTEAGVAEAPVGLIGFSLGGSLALVAAADASLRDRVACVAAMGSYFRLNDMLDAAVDGFRGPGGEQMSLAAPSAYTVAASLIDRLPDVDREVLARTIDAERDSPLEALSRVEPSSVGGEARLVLQLLRNRDRDTRRVLIESISGLALEMRALSPEGAIGGIGAPTWILHDERDQYVPFGQFRALREAARGRADFRFLAIRLLEHTEPVRPTLNPGVLLRDYLPGVANLYRFTRGAVGAVRRAARRA